MMLMTLPRVRLFDHQVSHALGAEECAGEYDSYLAVPLVERHIQDALLVEYDRVVDEYVNAPESVFGLLYHVTHLIVVGDVAGHADCFSRLLADVFRHSCSA